MFGRYPPSVSVVRPAAGVRERGYAYFNNDNDCAAPYDAMELTTQARALFTTHVANVPEEGVHAD